MANRAVGTGTAAWRRSRPLNERARIWELLSEFRPLDGLCRELRGQYPEAAPDELRGEVLTVLEDLAGRGLVRWQEGMPGRQARGGGA